MRVSGYLDRLVERFDAEPRPGDELETVAAPDGTATIVPVNDVQETRLETKFATEAWITTDKLYSLDDQR
ncbi:hypothetical protein [Haloarchaeobius litoreus]|uniref:Uncharacterized protein n=1 Tax=Haloarchaeobius litoreus TaxID=755306 RepID=A0ABD6DL03_9EURY|nr:hypothetical protein [Haloarchaeobius litoreus]